MTSRSTAGIGPGLITVSAAQFAQGQVGGAVASHELERILGLALAGLNRIGVEQVGNVRTRSQFQQQPNIGARDARTEGQVRQFIVKIAVVR